MERKTKIISGPAKHRKSWIFYIILFLFFGFLAVLFTWPLLPHITKGIIGQSNFTDGPFFIWNLWWVKKAFLFWQNPFYSNFVYYPANTNLTLHTLAFTTGLIYLPFSIFFKEIVSLNLIQLLSIIFSAIGMTFLVNYLTKADKFFEKLGGVAAGLIFGFSPFVFSHLLAGHYNLTMLWPIPPVALFLYKSIREKGWGNPVWLGIFAVLLGYLDLQLLIFGAIIASIILLVEIFSGIKSFFAMSRILRLLLALGIFLIVFLLPYGLMMRSSWAIKTNFITYNSADIRILFGYNPLNPYFHFWRLNEVIEMIGSYRENIVSLGYSAMLLALLGFILFARQYLREKITFLLIFSVSFLILLGPYYQKDGIIYYSIKLPYFYLQNLPFFNIGLVPTRFVMIAYFALAILAGLTMVSLIRFLAKRKLHLVAALLVALTIISISLEYYSGKMLIDYLPSHPYLKQIAKDKSDFTVLPYRSSQRDGFLQTEHQKPVVTGFLGRRIHDFYLSQYGQVYPIDRFMLGRANELNLNDNRAEITKIFSKYKIKYIVIDKLLQDKDQLTIVNLYLNRIGINEVYSDNSIIVYKL